MEMRKMNPSTLAPWPGYDIGKWTDVLSSARDAIAASPPELMRTVTVTGNLEGVEGEARLLVVLSKQLAAERGLAVTVKLNGRAFTAEFSRPDDTPDGRPWRR